MSQRQHKKYASKKKKGSPLLPILVGLGGLALLAFAVFTIFTGSRPKTAIEVTGAPSLKVDQERIDLGDVKLGETVEANFLISNTGDQLLRFNEKPYIEVKEGC